MTDQAQEKGSMVEPTQVPLCDNPSGMYCPDCRSTGLSHCSDPEHCGGMKPMRHGERAALAHAGH